MMSRHFSGPFLLAACALAAIAAWAAPPPTPRAGLAFGLGGAAGALLVMAWLRRRARAINGDRRFEALLEAAPEAIVIARKDGGIVLANARAEALLGLSCQELKTKRLEELLHPVELVTSADADSAEVTVTRLPGGAGRLFDAQRKGGGAVLVELSFSPMEAADGLYLIGIIRDIEERRRNEQRRGARRAACRIVAEAASLPAAAPALLRCLGERLGWHKAVLW